jgi:hypothetical protein
VMSDFCSMRPRISAAWASMRAKRRSPPSGPGATVPDTRASAHQRVALEALPPNRAAAARHDAPAGTAPTTLSRRSTDSAFDLPVDLLADRKLQSDPTRVREAHSQSIRSENARAWGGLRRRAACPARPPRPARAGRRSRRWHGRR